MPSINFKQVAVILSLLFALPFTVSAASPPSSQVLIGNVLREAPCGIAWIVDDSAAFVLDTKGPYTAGTAAPDGSYNLQKFPIGKANVTFEWGRVGNSVVGKIASDRAVTLDLTLSSGWPDWKTEFSGTPDGATGVAQGKSGPINWTLRTSPAPKSTSNSLVKLSIAADLPIHFVAGLDALPDFNSIDQTLQAARNRYAASRAKASGDWDDFIGAIEDNLNNSRLYASDNHLLAHCVSRTWNKTANGFPYFCWDSFFNANLAAIDDPVVARDTVRAILSYQGPEGNVPNHGHWENKSSLDRSQPPVGSLCVWKMHQRYPDDLDFLNEVYPKLVRWHDWWLKYRNAKKDGLLEWGTETGEFHKAQFETGWDDNLHFDTAMMSGTTMDCYAVDLSAMWAMDAHYLSLIATALGKPDDAARFRQDEVEMNQRINQRLWNENLGTYCSRFWDDADIAAQVEDSAFGKGFEGEYFSDETLTNSVAKKRDPHLFFKWRTKSPVRELASPDHWSARWTATFTPPATGTYRISAAADDGIRVNIDGKQVIDDWSIHTDRDKTFDVKLSEGKPVPVVIEYFRHDDGAELRFAIYHLHPANGAFLTRLTPMNFYPLSAGAADEDRAKLCLAILTNPSKFWGKYLLPTLAYDDPDYHQQEYWRGDVWGPTNYITWVGIKKYASPDQIATFADRSVNLFMHEWKAYGVCSENYLSTTGHHARDPHYTWGALLDLIALESIVDVDDSMQIVLNGAQTKTISLKNIPLLGARYDVKAEPGSAQLIRDGKVVLIAKGKIVHTKQGGHDAESAAAASGNDAPS